MPFLTDSAQRAEAIRDAGAEVVFIVGCEISAFCSGFLPGDTAHNAGTFRDHLREFFSHGKPVAVTEYGTCAYRGAGDLVGMAWQPPPDATLDLRFAAARLGCSARPP